MKAWQIQTDDGLFFVTAETRGKAKLAHHQEADGWGMAYWGGFIDSPNPRRCPALDGLEPTILNALRVGAITWGYADCGCWVMAEGLRDHEYPVIGGKLYCSERCARRCAGSLTGRRRDDGSLDSGRETRSCCGGSDDLGKVDKRDRE